MGTKKNNLGVRIAMAVIGIALTAVSVGLQKISGLGVDPFSVIIFGFSNAFHATYQTVPKLLQERNKNNFKKS